MSTQVSSYSSSEPYMSEPRIHEPNVQLRSIEIQVKKRDGVLVLFDIEKVRFTLGRAVQGLSKVSIEVILKEVIKNIYNGVSTPELEKAMILAAASFIERDPAYNNMAARLLLQYSYKDVFGFSVTGATYDPTYRKSFITSIQKGVEHTILSEKLLKFDLERLSKELRLERDHLLAYTGLQTLYDRYFLKVDNKKVELPQTFWMRVAMGLAINEPEKNERALEFYNVLSQLHYISSTPTLFHAGYVTAQLSSCYLTTVKDDLSHIFKCIGDNAQLSKWAGGIGNDWTSIRGTGSLIKSIHATSQGVIPFLKIANDVVVGITRSGIRRGGTCVYLETWHYDIEDFLDLRRNTGDERRRTHDMNTANWIPDLFMKRVINDEEWTLFSPDETPELHELYGLEFEKCYVAYEQKAQRGELILTKTISAKKLWRKMLSRLFETGHPWITFKDPCNVRSPQDHTGVIHSSNLCTEITLNTAGDETAVCNLGSVNLEKHLVNGRVNEELLAQTITTAIRMLDNVIDLNFYPTIEAKNSNMRHRPIGLGMMGFQDALFTLDIPFDSDTAVTFADEITETISYYAIKASSQLAEERGTYQSYKGSKWDRGLFPIDTIDLLEKERGMKIEISRTGKRDWRSLREQVSLHGMRNSNVMSIAPTATIANIAGCYPCIEPMYKNMYVKSNIAGEFTIANKYLIQELKALNIWDQEMLDQLKYYDGDLTMIDRIPQKLKDNYKGAFELDPVKLLKLTAVRGKWIDQSQSHNVFMKGVSGKKLDEIYMTAWKLGLKTTYYLRTLGASQIEKSTLDAKKYGFTQKRVYDQLGNGVANGNGNGSAYTNGNACDPNDLSCESCQ